MKHDLTLFLRHTGGLQSKVADLAVPTRVKLHPWKKTFQHDDLSFMVVAGKPIYPDEVINLPGREKA
ncbi:unnamed protein product [Lupinus luteus]|uniref:Uncharacterized protein n=1 Tax=Lupinus luteus TaxID=3873 RepID=A0AAV1Y1Q6_LUPLU